MERRAFTLLEVLVVAAILAALAAMLFPVFVQAKESARASACLSRFQQTGLAIQLYVGDYDDRLAPSQWRPGLPFDPVRDRTWVQLVRPYLKPFELTRCPSDHTHPARESFEPGLPAGNPDARFYAASLRSNLGFNALYLSPVRRIDQTWMPVPKEIGAVSDPSTTILLADSVWDVTPDGKPFGGGRFVVAPPCRYQMMNGSRVDTFAEGSNEQILAYGPTWEKGADDFLKFGSVWAWHRDKTIVLRLDGSAKAMSIPQVTAGCDAQSHWRGLISDSGSYQWDLR